MNGVNWDDKRALVALGCLLSLSLLLMGTVHWETVLVLCTLTALCAGWLRRGLARDWPTISTLFLALAGWSVFTAIPLPRVMLSVLSPAREALWTTVFSPFGTEVPSWAPISLDASSTVLEAAKWGSYACIAAISAHVVRIGRMAHLLFALWVSAVLLACVSVFQALSGLETVLGIYEPLAARGSHRFPSLLINPNNLASYCNLGTLAGLGLIASRRRLAPAPLIWAGTIGCFATTLLSGSRGGALALLLGVVAFTALRVGAHLGTRSSSADRPFSQILPGAGLLLVGGGIVLLGSTSTLWHELLSNDLSKGEALLRLAPAVGNFWLLGIGRGAFESSSFLLLGESANVVWQRVENFPLSWLLEWGMVVGGAALGLSFWLLRPRASLVGSRPSESAAYVALCVLGAQNLMDLGFELFSIAAAAAALAGAVSSRSHSTSPERAPRFRGRRLLPLSSIALVIISSLWAIPRGPGLQRVRNQLFEQLAQCEGADAKARQSLEQRLGREMRRRPAEPYFALIGAMLALKSGEDALPWAAAALRRAPHWGRAHYALGEALVRRGATPQALLAYRSAVQGDASLVPAVAARVTQLSREWPLLETVVPKDPGGAQVALALRSSLPEEEQALRRKLLGLAETLDPQSDQVQSALGFAYLHHLEEGLGSCPGSALCGLEDAKALEREIERLAAALDGNRECEGLRMRARLMALRGERVRAVQELSRCGECSLPEPCAQLRVQMASRLDSALRRQAELEYIALVCDGPVRCARAEAYIGGLAASRQAWLSAYEHFVRAARRDQRASYWLSAARSALAAGQSGKARAAYRQVLLLGEVDESLEAALERTLLIE